MKGRSGRKDLQFWLKGTAPGTERRNFRMKINPAFGTI